MATLVASIPDGADREEVFDWALARHPFRDGGAPVEDLDRALTSMAWLAVRSTSRFWAEDVALLSRATTSMAAGWSHAGVPVALSVRSLAAGLDLRYGTLPEGLGSLHGALAANLPGVDAEATHAWTAGGGGPAAHLWAVADPDADPTAPGLLDRLAGLDGVRWSLDALLAPVPDDVARDRAVALVHLATVLAADRLRQVQVDPLTTRAVEDPVVARLADTVGREQDRAEAALASGSLAVVVRLTAPDQAQLDAALGAATGAAPTAGTHWRSVTTASGALPIAVLAATATADLLRPPQHDVHGLPSRLWLRLDEHPEPLAVGGARVDLGRTVGGAPLGLPLDQLTSHALVTGASGSGKSSHVAALLHQVHEHGVPFWVIEPVKDEYRSLAIEGLRVWRPGAPDPGPRWSLNPLEVPAGTPVATHLDRLVALFRASFGLPDPLPHLLELGLTAVYEAAGWDLRSDRNLSSDLPRDQVDWPTLSDLVATCVALPALLGYEPQVQGNLRAALSARLGGLARGPRGRTLDGPDPFPMNEALHGPLVINLDAIGDDHARSFVMGLLLIRLSEARRSAPRPELVHVTVLEEAHRLLGRTTTAASAEHADPVGHVAEAFADLLAEIRSTGEGVVVVEQSPSRLVAAALVNTSTKVALRSTDADDHAALGAALGLAVGDASILSTLGRHEALVAWEGMDRPVRARLTARAITARPAEPVDPAATPARLSLLSDEVRAGAALVVLAGADDRARSRRWLLELLGAEVPGATPAVVRDLFTDCVTREIDALARRRRWGRATRLAATSAVLAGDDGGEHPRHLLAAGRQPHLACPVACPNGGCTTGELLEEQASSIRREGPATLVRLARDGEERRRRLARRVAAVIPVSAPVALRQHAHRCLTVQVFDAWADPDTVASLLGSSAAEIAP